MILIFYSENVMRYTLILCLLNEVKTEFYCNITNIFLANNGIY